MISVIIHFEFQNATLLATLVVFCLLLLCQGGFWHLDINIIVGIVELSF